jgi:hypothetical protein
MVTKKIVTNMGMIINWVYYNWTNQYELTFSSSCKSPSQKWRWTKLGLENIFKQWGGAICTQDAP